jgi:hypothetical protein
MAAPESITNWPLVKPSVGPKATHLTSVAETCCSTSKNKTPPHAQFSRRYKF